MPSYRGVACKNCGQKIVVKRIENPEDGPLSANEASALIRAEIPCPHCGRAGGYDAEDFITVETWDEVPGLPSDRKSNLRPN